MTDARQAGLIRHRRRPPLRGRAPGPHVRGRRDPAGRPARRVARPVPRPARPADGAVGSGKSTLLAVLSGLLRAGHRAGARRRRRASCATCGQMTAKEREQFRLQHTGFIFQGYNLFPALTARQQLEIVLKWGEGAGGGEARAAGRRDARPARAGARTSTCSRRSCPAARSSAWRSAGRW